MGERCSMSKAEIARLRAAQPLLRHRKVDERTYKRYLVATEAFLVRALLHYGFNSHIIDGLVQQLCIKTEVMYAEVRASIMLPIHFPQYICFLGKRRIVSRSLAKTHRIAVARRIQANASYSTESGDGLGPCCFFEGSARRRSCPLIGLLCHAALH